MVVDADMEREMESTKVKKVAVVIPTYNEAENIVSLITALLKIGDFIDVVVVDDNSLDQTAECVLKNFNNNKQVSLLKRQRKSGRGSAIIEGMRFITQKGRYDTIVEMDGDLSHDPSALPALLENTEHYDVVIGSRYIKNSEIINWPIRRKIVSKMANYYARSVFKVPINDYSGGFRCYSRNAAHYLINNKFITKGHASLLEIVYMLYKKGFTFCEVPIVFINRQKGYSKLSSGDFLEAIKNIFKIRASY